MWLIDCSLAYCLRHAKFPVHASENALVNTCLK